MQHVDSHGPCPLAADHRAFLTSTVKVPPDNATKGIRW